MTPGQEHESRPFVGLVAAVRIAWRRWPKQFAGDKAYSMPLIRTWMRCHGIGDVIPFRKDEIDRWPRGFRMRRFDRQAYRRRNAIERTIGLLKERRRLATRFEKLAVSFMAMVELAFAEIYLQTIFSERT